MLAFVTVGSTRFDALIQAILSAPILSSLRSRGYISLVVQCGNSTAEPGALPTLDEILNLQRDGVDIEIWRFRPSLQDAYKHADLVISHAGSGTILDVLRLGKPLIVVPNPTLLDNHQEELASSLSELGHLKASTVAELSQSIDDLDPSKVVPFPAFNGSRFRELLDGEMGYV